MKKQKAVNPLTARMTDDTRAYFRRVFNLQLDDFELRCRVADHILAVACKAQRYLEKARAANGEDPVLNTRYYDMCDNYLDLLHQLKLLGIMTEDDRRISATMLEDWIKQVAR